jgi:hypothetical protein
MRDGQTSPQRPRLVVSRSTCPPISPSPHANSFIIGTAVINTRTRAMRPVSRYLFVYVGASFSCASPLLPSSERSAGQRNKPNHSTVLARPVCQFVFVSATSFPCRFSELPPSYCSQTNRQQVQQPSKTIYSSICVRSRPLADFLLARAPLLLANLLSHTIPFPRVH